jgi:hypothetical protein
MFLCFLYALKLMFVYLFVCFSFLFSPRVFEGESLLCRCGPTAASRTALALLTLRWPAVATAAAAEAARGR